MNPQTPPGMFVIISRTSVSPPIPRNTKPKAIAPIKIINTMLVRRIVSCMAAFMLFMVSCPWAAESIMAPSAPTAADSVGDAIPAKIEPSTLVMSNRGGDKVNMTFLSKSPSSLISSAGATSGFTQARQRMYKRKSVTSIAPGITAPTKRRPTGTPITSPSRINIMLGGMI